MFSVFNLMPTCRSNSRVRSGHNIPYQYVVLRLFSYHHTLVLTLKKPVKKIKNKTVFCARKLVVYGFV